MIPEFIGPPVPPGSMPGLDRVLMETLEAHPSWSRDEETGTRVCDGAECDWVKLPGKAGKRPWLSHQRRALRAAIGAWMTNSYRSQS